MAVIAVAAVAAVALAVVGVGRLTPSPVPVDAPPSATPEPPPAGPVVFYEIVDAEGAALMARRLDGRSLPRRVAARGDVDYGRTWFVDPTGTTAIATLAGRDTDRLEAIAIADGSSLWQVDLPDDAVSEPTWSPDGLRIGLLRSPVEGGPTEALVIDARDGHVVRTIVPEDAVPQGFDADHALVLRQPLAGGEPARVGWRFLRIDPATNDVERLAAPPEVGPASTGPEDVDPARGVGVITDLTPDGSGAFVQVWPLAGGPSHTLASLPAVDSVSVDPGGDGVLVAANGGLRLIGWDGRATDLWSSDGSISDVRWSAAGDYLGLTTDRPGANLTVVEMATGRSVDLPIPGRVAQSVLVRVVGGLPLPAAALPVAEPTPTATLAPSGADLAVAPAVASAWFDTTSGNVILHVDRLVPTVDGGMRVAGSMQPIDAGPAAVPDDSGRTVTLLPRPGTTDMLVWLQTGQRGTGWLWDGTEKAQPLKLPADWPANAFDIAWRPDGRSIAGSASRASRHGDVEGVFVVAPIGGAKTRVIPIKGEYERLEGWWSPSELRVGHGICTEGCSGRYAYSGRLRVSDGRLTQFTAADRSRGAIDSISTDATGGLVMTAINEDPSDDVHVDWPANPDSPTGPTFVDFAADHRSLLIADRTASGTDLYRVDDPVRRAVDGRVLDAQRSLIGHFDRKGLDIDVSPDERWSLTTDRVGDHRLVELGTGRSWSIDPDRILSWWPAG